MRDKVLLLGASVLGMIVLPGFAGAQETAAPELSGAPQASRDVAEIIVTARKRQESILEVPVVTTVLSQEVLESRQVGDISDIASLTPGLLLGLAPAEIGTQISIRGVGTTAIDSGIDQSVSLNIDGLQITQGPAYSVGVFDMAQVEILKGPQALFFGKNSPGGVVSIRTADPGDTFEFIGRIGYEGVGDEWRTDAIVSTPITDTLGVRFAVRYIDYGGYFRNTATALPAFGGVQPPRKFGETETTYLRGTVLFEPTSSLTARLKVNHTRDRIRGGSNFQVGSCPDGIDDYLGIPGLTFYSANEDCRRDRNLNLVDMDPAAFGGLINNGRAFTNIDQTFGTLQVDYDVSDTIMLTSVSGYYNLKTKSLINGSLSGAAATPLAVQKVFERTEFTQELRLNTDLAGPLNFTGGGFYQNGNIDVEGDLAGNILLGLPPRLQSGTHDVDIETISLFGQARYDVTPGLEIAAGVRWTKEDRSDIGFTSLFGGPAQLVTPPRLSSSNWSPELTVTYRPTDDITLFGSLKQGYKSGSYNLIVPIDPANPDNSFGDEKVQGGELGIKARLADRQIFTNLAFYYYEYKGLQVGVNEAAEGSLPVLRTVNAGSSRVYGVDFDMSYRPLAVPGLSVNGAINWNRARFTDFQGAPCYGGQTVAAGCDQVYVEETGRYAGQDLSGTQLPRAPEWQITGAVDYELPIGDAMKVNLGVDAQYSARYPVNLGLNRADFFQDAFAKLGATVALAARNDAWELAFIGNNLTNKLTTGNCTNLNYAGGQILPGSISGGPTVGPAGLDEIVCTFDRGRELWVRLTIRPGNR